MTDSTDTQEPFILTDEDIESGNRLVQTLYDFKIQYSPSDLIQVFAGNAKGAGIPLSELLSAVVQHITAVYDELEIYTVMERDKCPNN